MSEPTRKAAPKTRRTALPAGPAASTRRPQMAGIAHLASVSVATVSHTLNGSPLINQETRDRIGELARKLDYAINQHAAPPRVDFATLDCETTFSD